MPEAKKLTPLQTFWAFLRLGLTSFGGPVAHLGYFREEFVERRRLMRDGDYADLVALCQFLPGPASSQVGIGIGLSQAGLRGALAAWAGFTLPSAILLVLFASGLALLGPEAAGSDWIHGLKVASVAVVALAVWGMAKNLCPDRSRGSLALLSAAVALTVPGVGGQLASMGLGGLAGWIWLKPSSEGVIVPHPVPVSRRMALASTALFILLLALLPWLGASGGPSMKLADSFYRSGSLVFGGGHVVLPLLQAEVVDPGWIDEDLFLAGYGAAQAVPGPLFTLSAFLGAVSRTGPGGWAGGALCLLAIFLPSFLLVIGLYPFWEGLRRRVGVRGALLGINASVVGLLLAALYTPVWTFGIRSPGDFVLALFAFGALSFWKAPPWLVVLLCGVTGGILPLLTG